MKDSKNILIERRIHRKQVDVLFRLLSASIKAKDTSIVDSFISQTEKVIDYSKELYPKEEVERYVPFNERKLHPPYNEIERSKTLALSLACLVTYIDSKIGYPEAQELVTDTLGQAARALDEGYAPCSALLCRVALEQSLRSLCELNNVDYEIGDMVGSINDKLRNKGIYNKPLWREIQSKLDLLNGPIHGLEGINEREISRMITWIDSFIKNNLSPIGDRESPSDRDSESSSED